MEEKEIVSMLLFCMENEEKIFLRLVPYILLHGILFVVFLIHF